MPNSAGIALTKLTLKQSHGINSKAFMLTMMDGNITFPPPPHAASAQSPLFPLQLPVNCGTPNQKMVPEGSLHHNADYFKVIMSPATILPSMRTVSWPIRRQTIADSSRFKFLSGFAWKIIRQEDPGIWRCGQLLQEESANIYAMTPTWLNFYIRPFSSKNQPKMDVLPDGREITMSKDSPKSPPMPSK